MLLEKDRKSKRSQRVTDDELFKNVILEIGLTNNIYFPWILS